MIKPLQSITLKNDSGEDTTYVVASAPAIVETTEPASVASFSDGSEGLPVSSLIADITPVQNLNGQSAPYPAGGGDNKFNIADCTARVAAFGLSHAIDGEYVRFYGTCSSGGTHGWKFVDVGAAMQTIGSTLSYKAFIVSGTPSITINSITYNSDNTLTINVSGLVTNQAYDFKIGVVGYTGTAPAAWTPYANICPITGWTGMNVVRNGFNQWDEETQIGYWNSLTGVHANSQGQLCSKNFIPIVSGNTYYFRKGSTTNQGEIIFYDANKNYIGYLTAPSYVNKTFTAPEGSAYAQFNLGSSYGTTYNHDISINYPSTDHDYHAYNGTTYPISWADEAGTVYGGTLDVTTGLLTVTYGIVEYDGSADESWTKGGDNECYIRNDAVKRFLDYRGQLFCDKLATYWHHETLVVQYGISAYGANNSYPSQNWLYVHLTDTTLTVADLKTWLQSNPITVCYPLATPQTYQLTPQAVLTILGQNNIWADTGDVEVAYCSDTKMYIDKVISEL